MGPQKGLIMKYTIIVIDEYFVMGSPNDPMGCPLAMGIDAHPKLRSAYVTRDEVRFTDDQGTRWVVPASRSVRLFVDQVDNRIQPKLPTTIVIDTTTPGATAESKETRKAKQSTPSAIQHKVKIKKEREAVAAGNVVIKTKYPQRSKVSYRATVPIGN